MLNRQSIHDQRPGAAPREVQIQPCTPTVMPRKQDASNKRHLQTPAYRPPEHARAVLESSYPCYGATKLVPRGYLCMDVGDGEMAPPQDGGLRGPKQEARPRD